MRTILLTLCFALVTSLAGAAIDLPTQVDAKALVQQAVAFAKQNSREKFFTEVTNPNGRFHFKTGTRKGLYIFVYDEKGVVLAHGDRIDVIGRNRWNDKDPDGKYWVREWTELAQKSGSGWVTYKQFNPADKHNMMNKSSYVELFNGMIIGCGIYGK